MLGHSKLLRKISRSLLPLIFAALCTSSLPAASRPAPARSALDPDYIAALAAANRFLQAWQTQDHETAILLLTDKVKRHTKEEQLETFFTPAARTQQAYEISSGKKLAPGRYVFRVTLFSSGQRSSRPRSSQLVIVRSEKNDWAIDKLP